MAQLKCYRCWFRDDSAMLVTQDSHENAALEAQELAGVQNSDIRDQRTEYLRRCKVRRTECLTDGTEKKWK